MDDRQAEILYFRRRVSDSLAMAAVAAGPCAQIAHLELARLYGEAIDALIARSERPAFRPVEKAAVADRSATDSRAGSSQEMPKSRGLVERKEQLASILFLLTSFGVTSA